MKKRIKELSKKDFEKILFLMSNSGHCIWDEEKVKKERNILKEYILETFRNERVFGYFYNKQLIGCGGIYFDKKNNIADIRHIFVYEGFQRKGKGREMVEFLEKTAKKEGIEDIRLNVFMGNDAINFYNKLGYSKYAYIMRKKLK